MQLARDAGEAGAQLRLGEHRAAVRTKLAWLEDQPKASQRSGGGEAGACRMEGAFLTPTPSSVAMESVRATSPAPDALATAAKVQKTATKAFFCPVGLFQ